MGFLETHKKPTQPNLNPQARIQHLNALLLVHMKCRPIGKVYVDLTLLVDSGEVNDIKMNISAEPDRTMHPSVQQG